MTRFPFNYLVQKIEEGLVSTSRYSNAAFSSSNNFHRLKQDQETEGHSYPLPVCKRHVTTVRIGIHTDDWDAGAGFSKQLRRQSSHLSFVARSYQYGRIIMHSSWPSLVSHVC